MTMAVNNNNSAINTFNALNKSFEIIKEEGGVTITHRIVFHEDAVVLYHEMTDEETIRAARKEVEIRIGECDTDILLLERIGEEGREAVMNIVERNLDDVTPHIPWRTVECDVNDKETYYVSLFEE